MRKWGIVISAAYALIVVLLVAPGLLVLSVEDPGKFRGHLLVSYLDYLSEAFSYLGTWILIGILFACQALLLFLSVDTSWRRLKPRAHILVSCLLTATLWALLTGAFIFALGFGIYGDRFGGGFLDRPVVLACWGAVWVAWAVVFYLYFRKPDARISQVTSWLLKGSVLELLIAVPAHVMTRRRHDCSAPGITGFGIATGIALMLLSFGPSVLLLYQKRVNQYAKRKAAAG